MGVAEAARRLDPALRNRAASIGWAATGTSVAIWIVVAWQVTHPSAHRIVLGWDTWGFTFAGAALMSLLMGISGSLILARHPTHPIAWLTVGAGIASAGTSLLLVGLSNRLVTRTDDGIVLGAFVAASAAQASPGLIALLPLWFPDGPRSAGRLWPLAIAAVAASLIRFLEIFFQPHANFMLPSFDPNPYAPSGLLADLWAWDRGAIGWWLSGFCLTVATASVAWRYARSTGIERRQLTWFALASVAFTLVAIWLAYRLLDLDAATQSGDLFIGLIFAALTLLPLATLFAITRYRLYDIDRIVNRTLVYGSLSGLLAGVFALSSFATEKALEFATGETSDAAIAVSTLIVTSVAGPLRRRIEDLVSRHVRYADARFGPYREELLRTLETLEPDAAADRLLREAAEHLRVSQAAVVLRHGDGGEVVISRLGDWDDSRTQARVPLGRGVDQIGEVRLAGRRSGQPYATAELEALAGVAVLLGRTIRATTAVRAEDGRARPTTARIRR